MPNSRKMIVEIDVAEDVFLAEALVEAGLAELVVLPALLRVGEHGVGLGDLLEALLGLPGRRGSCRDDT